jgi:hypothetical protein
MTASPTLSRTSLVLAGALILATHSARAEEGHVRLGVVVVIDQLSMSQIDRYEDLFGEGGFRRLLSQGSVARDARYLGAPTVTAHGHATLATGSYADHHGIVGNEWWEHDAVVHVNHDPKYRLLTRENEESDGTAPTDLRAPTFADALRWARPEAKVVSISLKDRGAILFGGARPIAAVWYDAVSDRWTTSTYYGTKLPVWVPSGAVSGAQTEWQRYANPRLCAFIPAGIRPSDAARCSERLYATRAVQDDGNAEGAKGFPHHLLAAGQPKRGATFMASPLSDEALFDLAANAIDGAELGDDDIPDLLFISASGFDHIGHSFGPESPESLDALLREDASLAKLFTALDAKVGAGRWVFALTADHGVQPSPHTAQADGKHAGTLDGGALQRTAEEALVKAFGARTYLSGLVGYGGLSYRTGALDGVDRPAADAIVVNALRTVNGVAAVYPRSLFVSHLALAGDAAAFGRSYFDGRSPDFIVQPQPLWIFGGWASHGTPYLADARVPLMFYRGGREPIPLEGTIDIASLTPTLALIMRSTPPSAAEAPILTRLAAALR